MTTEIILAKRAGLLTASSQPPIRRSSWHAGLSA